MSYNIVAEKDAWDGTPNMLNLIAVNFKEKYKNKGVGMVHHGISMYEIQ